VKLFTILFSMYVLALSFAPCADELECNEIYPTESSHSKHTHEKENCTPFCICACCGQHVVNKFNYFTPQNKIKTAVIEEYKVIVNQTFISQFNANIWQPPKIS